jgi:hypothetical protein
MGAVFSGGVSSAAWASPNGPFARGQAALKRLGPDGQAAAAFAAQTAPHVARGQRVGGVSADSSLSAIGKALSGNGGGGMGFPLPALLVISLVAAGGYGAWRLSTRARAG